MSQRAAGLAAAVEVRVARQKLTSVILTALVLGIVVGVIVGSLGAVLGWPPAVSGGLTGAIVVGSLQVLWKRQT